MIGNERISAMLSGIVSLLTTVFPNRVAALYVEGSYADGSALPTSDLDLLLVIRRQFGSAEEQHQVMQVVEALEQLCAVDLDISVEEEATLQYASPMLKYESRLAWGEDVAASRPLIPIALWARERMHAAYSLMVHVFGRPVPVQLPLVVPQPADPWFGYVNRTIRLPDGRVEPTTRNILRVVGWMATALMAAEAGHHVTKKRACFEQYGTIVGDEWTPVLEQLDAHCRTRWAYRLPQTAEEQAEFRRMLTGVVEFEQHFLLRYEAFLLRELGSGDQAAQEAALLSLRRTPFRRDGIREAVEALTKGAQAPIQTLASHVLGLLDERRQYIELEGE